MQMCIHKCVYIVTCVCMCMCVGVSVCMNAHAYFLMTTYKNMYIWKYVHTNVHVYGFIPIYICINGHAYKCTHLHGNVVYTYI